MINLPPLLILTGPTAVGKTALALKLATELNGEIICADSRTVYRGMDIATAKPSRQEREVVPHHLLDIVRPDEPFSLPEFQILATEIIQDIQKRQRLPMLVGGTVLYLNAISEGWQVPKVAPRYGLREQLEEEALKFGSEALYAQLKELDPAAAEHINPFNTRRIVRALEVYHTTGQLFSQAQGKSAPPYRIYKLGLTLEREKLYAQADKRITKMFENGLVDEVRRLLDVGYSPKTPAMTSVGYGQVIGYLTGELSLEEAQSRIRFTTHRYIRQQYTWFRRDSAINWLEADDPELEAKALAQVKAYFAD